MKNEKPRTIPGYIFVTETDGVLNHIHTVPEVAALEAKLSIKEPILHSHKLDDVSLFLQPTDLNALLNAWRESDLPMWQLVNNHQDRKNGRHGVPLEGGYALVLDIKGGEIIDANLAIVVGEHP